MGILSWLFPSTEDKLARANRLLDAGQFADAREVLLDLDHDEARRLLSLCENGMCRLNLEAALSWAEAGDEERVALHMELAEQYHRGGQDEHLRETRRQLREARERRRKERARVEEEARLLSADPLGLVGRGLLQPAVGDGHLDPDAEERAQRLALLVANYPNELQKDVAVLGPDFARAVLDLDDGRPDLALPALSSLAHPSPLVRWERARAMVALGDPGAAARELRGIVEATGRYPTFGNEHVGVLLALYLAESGDPAAGLRTLREVRAREPDVGGGLFAQLLFRAGELAEAESALRDLIRKHPKTDALYLLLAQVRLAGGHRAAAIDALERAMLTVCDSKGCAHKPADPTVVKELATLYLEDGQNTPRGLELAAQAGVGEKPPEAWEDAYLAALAAKANGDARADALADFLFEHTPEDHPGRPRIERYLAAA